MGHSFDGCREKIKRAKQQISDLERISGDVEKSGRYRVGTNIDHKAREHFLIFHINKSVDDPTPLFNIVSGEILQSLRSALDYAVSALAPATLTEDERRRIAFPIHRLSQTEYEAFRAARVKGLHPDAISYIDGLKPYKGGNERLWKLSELNNRDKHRLLLTAAMAFRQADVDTQAFIEPEIINYMQTIMLRQKFGGIVVPLKPSEPIFPPPKRMAVGPGSSHSIFPLEDGAEFFRIKALGAGPLQQRDDFKFGFQIAFNEPGIVQGEAVIPFLHQTLGLVTEITDALSGFV